MLKFLIAGLVGVAALVGSYGAFYAEGADPGIADLRITKADEPDPVLVGEDLIYTLKVMNDGPATSTDIILEDRLPLSVTFVSANASQGSCNQSGRVVTCNLGDLSADEMATSTIVVIPNQGGVIVNNARVRPTRPADPDRTNNTVQERTRVIDPAAADLSVTKTDSPDPVYVGETLTYSIEVTNNGPATSTAIVLQDRLPDSVRLVSATSPAGACSGSGGIVTCNLGDLPAGETATSTIRVRPKRAGEITNAVRVRGSEADPVRSNNEASATTTVNGPVPLPSGASVRIDVRPGSERNPLNLRNMGVVPVAVLGSSGFDVNEVDLSSIGFGVDGDNTRPAHKKGHIGDINDDDIEDMMLHFRTNQLGIDSSTQGGAEVTLHLTGQLDDGTDFEGEDTVKIVPLKGHGPGPRNDDTEDDEGNDDDGHSDRDNSGRGSHDDDEEYDGDKGRSSGRGNSGHGAGDDDDDRPSDRGNSGRGSGEDEEDDEDSRGRGRG